MRGYERKIDSLMTEVGSLKNEVLTIIMYILYMYNVYMIKIMSVLHIKKY